MKTKTEAMCCVCGQQPAVRGVREPICLDCLVGRYMADDDLIDDWMSQAQMACADIARTLDPANPAYRGGGDMTVLDAGAEVLADDVDAAYDHLSNIDATDPDAVDDAYDRLARIAGVCMAMMAWLNG